MQIQMGRFFFLSFFLSILCLLPLKPVVALPLYTNSRWIVDEDGARVKLACVNWPSHQEAAVAEGLSNHPVDLISKRIASLGFNCVRLTLPLFLATDQSLASLTVIQSFQRLGLLESLAGFQANNPSMLDLPLTSAYQAVVSNLADNNMMVILDSHFSEPSFHDNGVFGDQHFNPDLWVKGLTRIATMFSGVPNVVGMSLRNELRCPNQNVKDWYRYMQKGAEAVHSANPDVLVIISGLSDGTDLSFLLNQQLELTFTGKLVLEMHWHGSRVGRAGETSNPNKVCGRVVDSIMRRGGVLLQQGWPLMFVSELGVDDNRHLNCFFGLAAELDFDWALWTLEETNGLMNWNSSFFQRISALQSPLQGPDVSRVRRHKIIFHPSTGLCILRESGSEPLKLGPCTKSEAWGYTPQKLLTVKGTYFCLQAVGLGKPAKLSIICTKPGSNWENISDSKMYLSTKLGDGTRVCLDVDSSSTIVTDACKCLGRGDMCDPGSQWFKVVDSTNITRRPILQIG
ncbi:glycosyl hydrolase 5 family protein [Vitis vinifera]|uniref:Glycoside hydrolase family 5 domain-containing protein n=1 Tax=Vitis vinifera TaxID=29760 RepID=F6H253_VITVI|nr:glycosyl hydrolase 5 family protein [Vitis vinifera]|eukprot:XP_002284895.1 PREDICTED: uncharacterized protein LOC100253729 [Vitis vinifera]